VGCGIAEERSLCAKPLGTAQIIAMKSNIAECLGTVFFSELNIS